ncbi:MAG: HesA/MoeB/ThiF family protein [Candidatus Goldbacteria bacterium]|nr:HesA/MoeB/ThiF family protein [Candidatus Goldiibacteriota bacterium]
MDTRYDRNVRIKEIGVEGQNKLMSSSVLVIGAGGLGSPVIYYLAAAGTGTIAIADGDKVEEINLNRQILHFEADLGRLKTESAADKVKKLNSGVKVICHLQMITAQNAADIISQYDFIIDAVDNFAVKYLINDTCVKLKKPFCHGGALAWGGQIMTYVPGQACLRCFIPDVPKGEDAHTSINDGILGAAAGNIGTLQAMEAVKYLTGNNELLTGRMLFFDGLKTQYRVLNITKKQGCSACGG